MKKIGKQGLLAALCAVALMGGALAAGLADGDSLISLRFLEETYIPRVVDQGEELAREALDGAYEEAAARLDTMAAGFLKQAGAEQEGGHSAAYIRQTFSLYDSIRLASGSGVVVERGTVMLTHTGTVVDVTAGQEVPSGSLLSPSHRYLVAEDTQAVFVMHSDAADLAIQGDYALSVSGVEATPFADVSIYDWFRDPVLTCWKWDLFTGAGNSYTFAPDVKLDRAMIMTLMYHLAGDPERELRAARTTFPDTPDNEWFTPYVSWAAEQGLCVGNELGMFDPFRRLNREEMVQCLYNFATAYLGLELTERADLSVFADAGQVDAWAENAMSWAVGAGLISTLGARNEASRAEVAGMLANFVEKFL